MWDHPPSTFPQLECSLCYRFSICSKILSHKHLKDNKWTLPEVVTVAKGSRCPAEGWEWAGLRGPQECRMGVPGPHARARALWVLSQAGVTAKGHSHWALPGGRTDTVLEGKGARGQGADHTGQDWGQVQPLPSGRRGCCGAVWPAHNARGVHAKGRGAAAHGGCRAGVGRGPREARSGERASFPLNPKTATRLQGWGGEPEPQGGASGEGRRIRARLSQDGLGKANGPSTAGAGLRLDVAVSTGAPGRSV